VKSLGREGRRGGWLEPHPPLKAKAFFPLPGGDSKEKSDASI
jgi:hypothetical protein